MSYPAAATSVYGANGVIGYSAQHNARGPVDHRRPRRLVLQPAPLRPDVWVTDNAGGRAKKEETRYWLTRYWVGPNRMGRSGQPSLSSVLRTLRYHIAAPDRPRIGEILGAFDDKIAANDRVISRRG